MGDGNEKSINNEVRAVIKICKVEEKSVNIIRVLDHGYLHGPNSSYFIDMELCDLNLEEYIHEKNGNIPGLLDWETVDSVEGKFLIVAIMQQLLNGLIFIHEKDEIHRDLDPKNGDHLSF